MHVFGPVPQEPGRVDFQEALVTWSRIDQEQVRVELTGPFGELDVVESNLFMALLQLRTQLQGKKWLMYVNAARRDAWGPTDLNPCGVDEVRVSPDLNGPAAAEPLDALGVPSSPDHIGGASVTEQLLWHQEWVGVLSSGQMSWTDLDRSRKEPRASRGSS
ncbi:hypothetical protein [Saccharopolyspora gloriosae]|uniref:hypothetical protein n=1 Tax=Saccharopolyspora gloriosae TaxID=455344 RepID=UPI001FB5D986|nr:hypothetical protein [Saccharopolyspora gloriosae]